MDNDDFNQVNANVSAVTALLEDKMISWGSYQEGMPYTGYEGDAWIDHDTKANNYVRKHNPPGKLLSSQVASDILIRKFPSHL